MEKNRVDINQCLFTTNCTVPQNEIVSVSSIPSTPNKLPYNLTALNQYITCSICNGYYRHATTIVECSHTSCYICLKKHFHKFVENTYRQAYRTCPHPLCDTLLHTGDPINLECKSDHVKQYLVDSLLEQHVVDDDMKLRQSIKQQLDAQYATELEEYKSNHINNKHKHKKRRADVITEQHHVVRTVHIELKATDPKQQISNHVLQVDDSATIQHIKV